MIFDLILIVSLAGVNGLLIYYLTKKERIMGSKLGEDSSVFSTEKIKLILICFVFIVFYVIDLLVDQFGLGTQP